MLRVVLASICGSTLVSVFTTLAVVSLVSPPRVEAQTQVVRAQRFELVDPAGKVRSVLGISPEGHAAFWLYDAQERRKLLLRETNNGGVDISFFGSTGLNQFLLGVAPEGLPIMGMTDPQGRVRLHLGVSVPTANGDTPGFIYINGPDGNVVWIAP